MSKLIYLLALAAATYLIDRANQQRPRFVFSKLEFDETGLTIEGDFTMLRMTNRQKVTLTATPKNRRGEDAAIEPGSAKWELSDNSLGSLSPNPSNELEAEFVSHETNRGEAIITLRADGRVGEGEHEITGVLTAVVAAEDATIFNILAGEASDVETV